MLVGREEGGVGPAISDAEGAGAEGLGRRRGVAGRAVSLAAIEADDGAVAAGDGGGVEAGFGGGVEAGTGAAEERGKEEE